MLELETGGVMALLAQASPAAAGVPAAERQDILDTVAAPHNLDAYTALLARDGTRIPVEVAARALDDGRLISVVRDLRPTLEAVELKERLASQERLAGLGRLAASVGHEINNPLTYVLTNLDIGLEALADRAVSEDTMPILRIVNQFSSYAYAYNRQRLRPMLQGDLGERAVNMGTQVMLGWLMYATKNALSDRRSFADSVAELVEEPQAAAWGAMQDSMVLGNVMRAVGYYDRVAQNFGASTSQALGQSVAGGTFGAVTRQQQDRDVSGAELAVSFMGAGPQLLVKGAEAILNKDSPRQDYLAAQISPLQNLVWARILNKAGVSERVRDEFGFVPGIVPSDVYRPQRPTLRSR